MGEAEDLVLWTKTRGGLGGSHAQTVDGIHLTATPVREGGRGRGAERPIHSWRWSAGTWRGVAHVAFSGLVRGADTEGIAHTRAIGAVFPIRRAVAEVLDYARLIADVEAGETQRARESATRRKNGVTQ